MHEKEATLRAFGRWHLGILRLGDAIGAYDDVVRGAHQAPVYESRRDGVCIAFEKVNGLNRLRLLTMTRQHLYSGILAAARRQGVEICTRSEAVAARAEGALELQDGRCLSADLVITADGVRDWVGLLGAQRKYQDGLIRVLLERTDLVGGPWEHVIDSWAFTPRTLRSTIENALQRWEAQERGLTDHTQARSAELACTRALGSGTPWDDVGLRAAPACSMAANPRHARAKEARG